jgi:hypothetical protein
VFCRASVPTGEVAPTGKSAQADKICELEILTKILQILLVVNRDIRSIACAQGSGEPSVETDE